MVGQACWHLTTPRTTNDTLCLIFFFFFRLWTMPTSRELPHGTLNPKIKRPSFYPMYTTLTTTPSLWIHTAGQRTPWRFRMCSFSPFSKGYSHISHMPYYSVHNHLTIYTPAPGQPILGEKKQLLSPILTRDELYLKKKTSSNRLQSSVQREKSSFLMQLQALFP